MKKHFENQLIQIIENDAWMMHILKIIRELDLNDSWIGAGFIRNKVWDKLHNKNRTVLNDIDVIYFDSSETNKAAELAIEYQLKKTTSNLNWSVKNQARMHLKNGHSPYTNTNEAISFWPETATAIAIRLTVNNVIEYIAPYGLEDLFNLRLVPTPNVDIRTFQHRIQEKQWIKIWPKLILHTSSL
ncbi:nucleotidyltransferase family protein [Tenacibaculum amylolyticum]|uniref:nucleotidyltransferase family protein n=1 Tax=Tenacibaculum amylolyticum TaxID=104269 RepID=UPI003892EA76